MSEHPTYNPIVRVIDDDVGVRDGLTNLLQAAGLSVLSYVSPREFIKAWRPSDQGCLILDIRFPDENGLDFQTQLQSLAVTMPVILMSGYADVPSTVRGMKAGAIDFLTKPFDDEAVLDAIDTAFKTDVTRVENESQLRMLAKRHASLTTRERQVFSLVTLGLMNKQIAGELNLSEITVKVHRGTMMRKMNVKTLADLVRASELLKFDEDL
jgi:FixJ family two-component response regulator